MDYPHFKKAYDECSHQSIPLPENYTENDKDGMSALGLGCVKTPSMI